MNGTAAEDPTSSRRPPDPRSAADLVAFVALLNELRAFAGNPGYIKLERLADRKVGRGSLPHSNTHRILSGRKDLAFVHDPERFVYSLAKVCDVPPEPWVAQLKTLLTVVESPEPPMEPAVGSTEGSSTPFPVSRRQRLFRSWPARLTALSAALLTVSSGLIWVATRVEPVPEPVDYDFPIVVRSGESDLRLAIDQDSAQPGTPAIVVAGTSPTTRNGWEFVAPHRNNDRYRQLRPVGPVMMCLDVHDSSFDDGATVEQAGCTGQNDQYWDVQRSGGARNRIVSLHSGKCLAVAGADPQAGMRLVQHTCDDRKAAQHWTVGRAAMLTGPTTPASASASVRTAEMGPDPAEFPAGGADAPCDDESSGLDPAATTWTAPPFLIRDEDAARGQIGIGTSGSGAVQLLRANRRAVGGTEETFYWAEAWVHFTPTQFRGYLQWTSVPGPGGWHTCAMDLVREHQRGHTQALPRRRDGRQVWFRACLAYHPQRPWRSEERHIACTGRY